MHFKDKDGTTVNFARGELYSLRLTGIQARENGELLTNYCHKIPFRDGKKPLFCYIFCKFRLDSAKRLKIKLPSEYFETGENLYISNTVKTLLETAFYVRHTSTWG